MSLRPPPSVGRSRQGPLQHRAAGRWPPPGQTCLRVTEAARPPRFTDALPRARDPVVALSVVRAATGCRVSWSVISRQRSGIEMQSTEPTDHMLAALLVRKAPCLSTFIHSFIYSIHSDFQKITNSVAIMRQTLPGNEVTAENPRHKVPVLRELTV